MGAGPNRPYTHSVDTTVTDPLVGQVLDGRYRIESRIARGGMATVYVARDIKLGRAIALKVMHANLAQDEEFVRRFIGEAKSAAALSHPNVVAVFDQGTDRQHVFLAMEYVPGRTLRDLLTERGRLGPRQALGIIQPVLAALGAAHRAGLIHRDVKPENVLLTDDGQVKVADFGLARAETDSKQTKTGMIIGTVAYMAPEQVLNGSADARADVYSAGVLLFELLTGHQPHQADSPLSVAYKHVNEVVPLPSSVLPGLPAQLDALVATATSHDPSRRPSDANHLLALVTETQRALPPGIDQTMAGVPATFQQGPARHAGASHTTVLPPGAAFPGTRSPQQPPEPAMERLISFFTGKFVLFGVALIAVLVLGWAVWYQTVGQYNTVPSSLIGMSIEQASKTLIADGFNVATGKARPSDKVPAGKVAETDPAPGARLSKGQRVTLFPSRGPLPISVPNVSGTLQDATATLTKAGFTNIANPTTKPSTTIALGQVMGTDPQAGSVIQPGDPITIIVSAGVQMPSLAGQTRDAAQQALEQLGLNLNIQFQDVGGTPPNTVQSTNPAAGTALTNGETIILQATTKNCSSFLGIQYNCNNGQGNGQGQGQQVQVPSLLGMQCHDAQKALRDAGLQSRVIRLGGNTVRAQLPVSGSQAQSGSEVTITCSP
ncbi:MAG: hypothetical protein JWN00_3609 [Actinomycetia bacterium]|nr:hypothetical protein [Actinomycetes bacterium]